MSDSEDRPAPLVDALLHNTQMIIKKHLGPPPEQTTGKLQYFAPELEMREMNIKEWQKAIAAWAERKGWHDPSRSFGDWTSLFHSELSEAYEDFRNHRKFDEVYYEGEKPCGIPIEMADEVIRIMHFCETYGINLHEMIALKMAYNETRPHRHGGKRQ